MVTISFNTTVEESVLRNEPTDPLDNKKHLFLGPPTPLESYRFEILDARNSLEAVPFQGIKYATDYDSEHRHQLPIFKETEESTELQEHLLEWARLNIAYFQADKNQFPALTKLSKDNPCYYWTTELPLQGLQYDKDPTQTDNETDPNTFKYLDTDSYGLPKGWL